MGAGFMKVIAVLLALCIAGCLHDTDYECITFKVDRLNNECVTDCPIRSDCTEMEFCSDQPLEEMVEYCQSL